MRGEFKYSCSQCGEADSEALHRHSELNERKELQVASLDVLVCRHWLQFFTSFFIS